MKTYWNGGKRVYPKVSGLSHNERNNSSIKRPLRSNTKGYDGKTHLTGSKNRNKTEPSDIELYHLQFSLQAASPETFGYTLIWFHDFLFSARDGGEWSASHIGCFTPGVRSPGTLCTGGCVGLRAVLDAVAKTKKKSYYYR
jgi:hypothetical protein